MNIELSYHVATLFESHVFCDPLGPNVEGQMPQMTSPLPWRRVVAAQADVRAGQTSALPGLAHI